MKKLLLALLITTCPTAALADHTSSIDFAIAGLSAQVKCIDSFIVKNSKDVVRSFGQRQPDPTKFTMGLREQLRVLADHFACTLKYKKSKFLTYWEALLPSKAVLEAPEIATFDELIQQLAITNRLAWTIIHSFQKGNGYITLFHESPGIDRHFVSAKNALLRLDKMLA